MHLQCLLLTLWLKNYVDQKIWELTKPWCTRTSAGDNLFKMLTLIHTKEASKSCFLNETQPIKPHNYNNWRKWCMMVGYRQTINKPSVVMHRSPEYAYQIFCCCCCCFFLPFWVNRQKISNLVFSWFGWPIFLFKQYFQSMILNFIYSLPYFISHFHNYMLKLFFPWFLLHRH